jgi:hypothetical protein
VGRLRTAAAGDAWPCSDISAGADVVLCGAALVIRSTPLRVGRRQGKVLRTGQVLTFAPALQVRTRLSAQLPAVTIRAPSLVFWQVASTTGAAGGWEPSKGPPAPDDGDPTRSWGVAVGLL